MERDISLIFLASRRERFQLTRSRGAWLQGSSAEWSIYYFNSHAHVERDLEFLGLDKSKYISTHTLTWSVTGNNRRGRQRINISTHTLTWSVTSRMTKKQREELFQLTRSRGAWLERTTTKHREEWISTHTLTWSVTGLNMKRRIWTYHISTHTLTWSVTGGGAKYYSDVLDFNSHAHVERDRSWRQRYQYNPYFNSHAHVERDLSRYSWPLSLCLFQLTRSRGAWRTKVGAYWKGSEFQLTRSRGAWPESEDLPPF